MKRLAALALALLLSAGAFAESVPDGTSYSAFMVTYDEASIEGWQTVLYLEASGLLFSAYTDDAEITVSLDENGGAESAAAFLGDHKANVSRYGRVISSSGPDPWSDPWGTGGANMRYSYMYLNGTDTDDLYQTDVFVAPVTANYYAVITLNCWGDGAQARIRAFEDMFLPSIKIEARKVSTLFMAYVKDAGAKDGRIFLTLDFCTVEYDSSIFTVYTENDSPVDYQYFLADDALLWMPEMNGALYTARETKPDADALQRFVSDYYAANNMHGIYQVLFNEANEIIWMMHYNAF